jgi:deoxyribodipyrimidine photo-lyase
MTEATQLVWLRADLRLHDNTALWNASRRGPVVVVYCLTPQTWREHDDAPIKLDFWLRNLRALAEQLARVNIPLRILEVPAWRDCPQALTALASETGSTGLWFNDEYGIHEQRRDAAVSAACEAAGLECHRFVDQTLFRPGSLLTQAGTMFKVYSQFRRAAYRELRASLPACCPPPVAQPRLALASDPVPDLVPGLVACDESQRCLWPAGEEPANRRLQAFCESSIADYDNDRDLPAVDGTSRLSAYLTAGVLSPRQCLHAALAVNQGEFDGGNPGIVSWINELLWREFYKHILVCYPQVSRGRAFQPHTESLRWRQDPAGLKAWQEGQTGIPIIDAGMRQLKATGWMHNRLRMLTAMFLTKNLLIDWREGERWFMQNLIDGDLAANNGGWQWSASTGTDAAPYFRIFNPVTQSEKFDPEGAYIRKWVPELSGVKGKQIHQPVSPDLFGGSGYPAPIVDLRQSRQRALDAFKSLGDRP